MILVILELVIPLIGILWLYQFIYQENLTFSGDYTIFKKSYPKKKYFWYKWYIHFDFTYPFF